MADQWRERARQALERYFERASFPRVILSIIVLITGGVGFFVSFGLLHLREVRMCIRYPIAVAVAYCGFLGLLRAWAEIERRRMNLEDAKPSEIEEVEQPNFPSGSPDRPSWLDLFDLTDFWVDDAEGCLVVLALVILIAGAVGVLISVITAAPALIAEVFLDAVLMTLLYRHLKNAACHHWLGSAIRRTWLSALILALLLTLAGTLIQAQWPKAKSIGDVWRQRSPEKK